MWGALRLCQDELKDKRIAYCISGESTGMDIALGHRGRLEVQVISKGKNSHFQRSLAGSERSVQDGAHDPGDRPHGGTAAGGRNF